MEQQDYLRKRAHESKIVNHFAENLLKSGSDTEILVFVGILQRRFEHCQKSKMSIDPKIPDAFQFLREIRAPATQQQHNIPMFGIIATQVADPKYSTLEGDEPIILRINRRIELKMVAKDRDDRPLCHGGLGVKLSVDLGFKDDPIKRILTEVGDKRDGSYVIAFTPDTPGMMTLTIKIDNLDIKVNLFVFLLFHHWSQTKMHLSVCHARVIGEPIFAVYTNTSASFRYLSLLYVLFESRFENCYVCVRWQNVGLQRLR